MSSPVCNRFLPISPFLFLFPRHSCFPSSGVLLHIQNSASNLCHFGFQSTSHRTHWFCLSRVRVTVPLAPNLQQFSSSQQADWVSPSIAEQPPGSHLHVRQKAPSRIPDRLHGTFIKRLWTFLSAMCHAGCKVVCRIFSPWMCRGREGGRVRREWGRMKEIVYESAG